MKRCNVLALAGAFGATTAFASVASAQTMTNQTSSVPGAERSYLEQPLAAPHKAFELIGGMGYTQGFGSLEEGVGMTSVATPGISFDVGVGYRASPHWGITVTGQYQEFVAERNAAARGTTLTLAAVYHLAPYVRSNPWVAFGGGYRSLFERTTTGADLMAQGPQLAKLTAGFDIRLNQDIAVSPIIGADVNMFLWQEGASTVTIENPQLSTFIFVGAQGRFDFVGTREGGPKGTMARSARR